MCLPRNNLSYLVADTAHCIQVVIGQPVVPDDLEDKASLLSLPNELIDRIFDHLPREMGCFPALRVCRRFLHIGLRHVLHRDVFTFTSAEYDYTFSGSSRRVLRPMRPNLPDHVQLSVSRQPNRRKFETNGRTLLDTIIKSHCAFAFDPMAFITKIHIVFHLPELRLYARLPRVPTRSGLTRRERWLYLMTDHTRDQAIERLLSEVPHQRAELHFGCLRVLPLAFKNLRLVQLSFYRRELSWYPADYGFAYAVWIGRYLHIKIKKIVKTVEFPKEWELISDVLHKIIDEGFDL